MQIAPPAPLATPLPAPGPALEATGHRTFVPRNPAGTRVAALLGGVDGARHGSHLQVADALIGYGRPGGYDSLANARRAAYMLTRGESRAAAGIYEQGSRWYVRAMGSFEPGSGTRLALLHLEGSTSAHLAGIADPRLAMIVDGATKLFARDAHHGRPGSWAAA